MLYEYEIFETNPYQASVALGWSNDQGFYSERSMAYAVFLYLEHEW